MCFATRTVAVPNMSKTATDLASSAMRTVRLVTDQFHQVPGYDTGVSHALVNAVGAGDQAETFRLHRTRDIVAFGRHDTISPGYPDAVRASVKQGFTPIERLAGGRAAVFHTGTLAFAWAVPTPDPRSSITDRFTFVSKLLCGAIAQLGLPAAVGELPGEYCPGAYSVHIGGRTKVMGVGQRLVRGAAHVGGVICVTGGDRIRDVLTPVYRALALEWDPSTAGAIADHQPDVRLDDVQDLVISELANHFELEKSSLPHAIVAAGMALGPGHVSPAAGV